MSDGFAALFPLIFDSITEGVFTVDERFRVTSFNAAAARITGIPADRAIGRPCHEVLRASICQRGCALRETLRSGEPQREVRVDILDSEMERVPIAVSTAVLEDRDGEMIGGVEIFRDIREVEALRTELADRRGFGDMIGRSPSMREIFALIPQVAVSDAPVLISGPSGTGKEIVAEAIHDQSPRRERPFVRVNCGALPDSLLESELFGHRRGAFTGAVGNAPGRFREADGGTLFLDEIGDVSPAFQVKLLRALERGEIQPLGESRPNPVDVRAIAATNRDLTARVRDGLFREDLYYRLRVIPIELPPLAERREDIPLLVAHFAREIAARTGREEPSFSRATLAALYDYDFPGNVRELKNIVERAIVFCPGSSVEPHHLPVEVSQKTEPEMTKRTVRRARLSDRRLTAARPLAPDRDREPPELRGLLAALDASGWNRSETARALGISRTTLWRRMKEHGLL